METIKKPTKLTDITSDLSDVFYKLRKHEYPLNEAKEIINVAGKIIKAVAVQVAYKQLTKSSEDIPYVH